MAQNSAGSSEPVSTLRVPGTSDNPMCADSKDLQHQRMVAGKLYYANDPQLTSMRHQTLRLLHRLNHELDPADDEGRMTVLTELLGGMDSKQPACIVSPFFADYGCNIYLGADVYINAGCTILDGASVHIGARTLLGPNIQLYPATHPLDPAVRNGTSGPEYGKPIKIGEDCWIGGAAIILGGVTIGDGSVVGAGSVVTKDVAPRTVVAGNPARFIKSVDSPETFL